jgi:hypothetical protein
MEEMNCRYTDNDWKKQQALRAQGIRFEIKKVDKNKFAIYVNENDAIKILSGKITISE